MSYRIIEVIKPGAQGAKGDPGDPGVGGMPNGGATGDLLTKNSGTDQDASFLPPSTQHKLLWDDYKAHFTSAAKGQGAPSLADIGNGHQLIKFGVNDSMFVEFHVLHSYAAGSLAFLHVHWLPGTTMVAGETVTWNFDCIVARGHHQGDSFTGARTPFTVTYTADGTEVAGEHIISEVTTGASLLEADSILLAECTRGIGTYTGDVFGIQCDLHVQIDRFGTVSKVPDFNVEV